MEGINSDRTKANKTKFIKRFSQLKSAERDLSSERKIGIVLTEQDRVKD